MEGLDFGCSEKVVEKSNWGQYVITGAHDYSWAPGDNNDNNDNDNDNNGHLTINTVRQSWSLP